MIGTYTGITAEEINIAGYYEDSEIPVAIEPPEGVFIVEGQEEQLVLKLKVVEKKTEEDDG